MGERFLEERPDVAACTDSLPFLLLILFAVFVIV